MIDNQNLYEVIYALAARGGREDILFGDSFPRAREAFDRSLVCEAFPEVWFEIPLTGKPWLDIHVLTSRNDLAPDTAFDNYHTGNHPEVFRWFSSQDTDIVRQLALSWDVGSAATMEPAVQLLVHPKAPIQTRCDFLDVAGKPDAAKAFKAFAKRIPDRWFPCYVGVFPSRDNHCLRVECIPDKVITALYARDATLLESHLRQVGFDCVNAEMLNCLQAMMASPFQFEFQFDVLPDGFAGSVLGASTRFPILDETGKRQAFTVTGQAGNLMRAVQSWQLADDRWKLLEDCVFATRVKRGNYSASVFCYPAFVKLKWQEDRPLNAKAYLMCGERKEER